jgi:RNA polymerase sigma-54 factor
MTMKQAGELLDIHETTVSRAAAGKYVETPQGTFPLNYFFTTGFSNNDGDEVSSRAVMEKIKELISQEDPAKPLSDAKLTELLEADGLAVARRTVAKYREALNIPASSLRKKYL